MRANHCEIRHWRSLKLQARTELLQALSDEQLQLLAFNTDKSAKDPSSWGWWVDPEFNPQGQQLCGARGEQLVPLEILSGNAVYWLILAGRGWGKTRTGAEFIRGRVESHLAGRIALIGKDPGEVRDVMIEGPSGILATASKFYKPGYQPSLKKITWPRTGAIASVYSSEEYDELRGPQHDTAWVDELFKFRYQEETWDNLLFGARQKGAQIIICITSTPKPSKLLKEILRDPLTYLTKGTSFENLANLSATYRTIVRKYEGTRLGRQELNAEILEDVEGALWSSGIIEMHRARAIPPNVQLLRGVVAIDPPAASSKRSAEAGIVSAFRADNGHAYVVRDSSFGMAKPHAWATKAVGDYKELGLDRIIGETNNGGEMVENTISAIDGRIPFKAVHASRGKRTRAEPIAALYEKGMVHHVGVFPELEEQMCTWDSTDPTAESPDRMDALVWALTELFEVEYADLSEASFGVELLSSSEGPSL